MSGPQSPRSNADRNLLFGILALQMDFISRDALVSAMHAWVLAKERPLGQILLDQRALAPDAHALLEALVQKHLGMHGNDPEKSLAAVSSVGSAREQLAQIPDAALQASLTHVPAASSSAQERTVSSPAYVAPLTPRGSLGRPSGEDPDATRLPGAGLATSSGLRFRILRPHAKGGLGQVSVARDEELHREVAVKEIQERYADHPDSRSRFVMEAEITGGLEHPGIVPVYGLGQYADGRPFYAMRFIRGDSLKDAIERFHQAEQPGRDPGERALALRDLLGRFTDVCNAIAYAHSRGVLHRDLKPGNVMLGQYGETLVVDWGLAKPLGRTEGSVASAEGCLQPASASGPDATRTGSALGTPQYMSPEQAAGRLDELGPASDVYSLGATLYTLLTGKPPFKSEDVGVVLQKVQHGDFPPPREIKRTVPAPLQAVCLKAMALKPEDRYPSPRALARDIEQWLADEPVSAWREPWTIKLRRWLGRHRTLVTSAAAAVLMAAVSLAAATFLLKKANDQLTAAQEQERTAKEKEQAARLAAERYLKFLYTTNMALARAAWKEGDVKRAEKILNLWRPTPGRDDRRGPEWAELWRLTHSNLVTFEGHTGAAYSVAFSVDGKRLASGGSDATVKLWDVPPAEGPGAEQRTDHEWATFQGHKGPVDTVLFIPGGLLASGSEDQTVKLWDVAQQKLRATLEGHTAAVRSLAVSADGKTLASGSSDGTVRLWELPSGKFRATLDGHRGPVLAVALSPDGTTLAAGGAKTSDEKGEGHVALWDVDKGMELPPFPDRINYPASALAFAPDGKTLAIGRRVDGTVKLWDLDSQKRQPIKGYTGTVHSVAFSPDGRVLAAACDDQVVRLWDLSARQWRPLLKGHTDSVYAVAFSPDGKVVASASGDKTVKLWPVDMKAKP